MSHFGQNDSSLQCEYCGLAITRAIVHEDCYDRLTTETFVGEVETAEDVEFEVMSDLLDRQEQEREYREFMNRNTRWPRRENKVGFDRQFGYPSHWD